MKLNYKKRKYLGSFEFSNIYFDVFKLNNDEVIVSCSEIKGIIIGYSPIMDTALSLEENNKNILKYVRDILEANFEDYLKQILNDKNRLIYSQ